jgi:hypothetical protein
MCRAANWRSLAGYGYLNESTSADSVWQFPAGTSEFIRKRDTALGKREERPLKKPLGVGGCQSAIDPGLVAGRAPLIQFTDVDPTPFFNSEFENGPRFASRAARPSTHI